MAMLDIPSEATDSTSEVSIHHSQSGYSSHTSTGLDTAQ